MKIRNVRARTDVQNVLKIFHIPNLKYTENYENEVIVKMKKKWPLFDELARIKKEK